MTNASASDNNDTVTVLHTNDVRGRMVEGDYNGVIGDALYQVSQMTRGLKEQPLSLILGTLSKVF